VATTLFSNSSKFGFDISDYKDCCSIVDFSDAIFHKIDANHDGRLSFDEFIGFFRNKDLMNNLDIGIRFSLIIFLNLFRLKYLFK
jgi:hypothetical protein